MLVLLFLWDFRFGGDEISNIDRVVTGSRWFLSGWCLPEQVIHSIEKSYHLIGGPLVILASLSLDIFLQDVVINHSGPPGLGVLGEVTQEGSWY